MIIPITKEDIPYEFEIELGGEVFVIELHHNSEHDFFTLDLTKNGEVLVFGEKLVYGQRLFEIYQDERFPKVALVPKDKAGNDDRITYENLGETVFLYVGDVDE